MHTRLQNAPRTSGLLTVSTSDSRVQAMRLARALQALTKGLANPWDESTDFFRGFSASMPAGAPINADTFRSSLRVGTRYQISLSPAEETLTKLGHSATELGDDAAGGFEQLGVVMRATLTDLSLAFARARGVTRVRVWLFGRTADDVLVGLRSLSTET
jgi:hypothetical protein